MTADGFLIIRFIFTEIWKLFNSFFIPGTRVTPGTIGVFMILSSFVLRIILQVIRVDAQIESANDRKQAKADRAAWKAEREAWKAEREAWKSKRRRH